MTTKTEIVATFDPLPWQIAPWRDRSRIMLLTGSAGGGKSRLAAEKVHAFLLRYPGAVAICLRKAREYASKSVVYALKTAIGADPSVRYNGSELMFHYDNGSRIFVAGMQDESQVQALRSINGDGAADIIWAEEANAFAQDDHNELLARLRGKVSPWQQIIYSTNPDYPGHWIKQRLMDGGEAKTYFSRAEDNPYNPTSYADTLAMITGVKHQRLVLGLWVQAEGAVYEFDDAIHVVDPFPIPAEWRRFRSVDFGYTNPFVFQWWAMDGDDRMFLYREIYMSGRTVRTHAEQANRLSTGESCEATVADHDAEDRATLAESGIYTIPADKAVSVGIGKVQERLRLAGDGKPRLFIMRGATVEIDGVLDASYHPTSTLSEMPGYVWEQPRDGRAAKEVPLKVNDHGMDALRYAVMYADANHWIID
jgi:phage terminase large subunit